MKKSGKLCRLELVSTNWAEEFPDCAKLFRRVGWFLFFEKITCYNLEATRSFVQNCSNSCVEFQTLKIELTKELISKATGLAIEGECRFKKFPFEFDPSIFRFPGFESLDWNKGIHLSTVKPEWREVIGTVQCYITCEGRFATMYKYHFRFLLHLNDQSKMNLPLFFFKSLI